MKVFELLDSPEKWTKYDLSRTTTDHYCNPFHVDAAKWCLIGAILRCYRGVEKNIFATVREHVGKSISNWNDQACYEDVLDLAKKLDI